MHLSYKTSRNERGQINCKTCARPYIRKSQKSPNWRSYASALPFFFQCLRYTLWNESVHQFSFRVYPMRKVFYDHLASVNFSLSHPIATYLRDEIFKHFLYEIFNYFLCGPLSYLRILRISSFPTYLQVLIYQCYVMSCDICSAAGHIYLIITRPTVQHSVDFFGIC